jgi:quinol monooxygenase YgiN
MKAIRVVVNNESESVEAADAAIAARIEVCKRTEATEDGCLQYEVFRSQLRPQRFTLLELWASKAAYDKHWHLQQEREQANPASAPSAAPGRRSVTIEFYQQNIYQRLDGVWQPADPEERIDTIRWA